jgi:hypothetical protein
MSVKSPLGLLGEIDGGVNGKLVAVVTFAVEFVAAPKSNEPELNVGAA